jgi:hypothetical protein
VLARGFESFHSLEESFASGNYELEVNTLNDGSPTVSLDLPATGYPAVTTFTVFEEAQMIDSDEAFVFEWEPIPGGTEDDLVFFEIEDQSGNYVFESPGLFEDGQLTGESTRITVPAGTLNPGEHYYGFLLVARLVDQDEDGYPGVFTVSALEKAVEMPIRTSGGTDSFAPGFITSAPSPGASGVERNSVVTFSFDENPADLRYSWSPDGRRLFCRPDAGLPPSTMVTWTLNPSGSATKLRDESGNPLPDEQWGDFTTGDDSNIGDPDVLRFEIGKGRGFIQDGPTATDMGSYFAGFFADLSGVATVSSIDLEIPGNRRWPSRKPATSAAFSRKVTTP